MLRYKKIPEYERQELKAIEEILNERVFHDDTLNDLENRRNEIYMNLIKKYGKT